MVQENHMELNLSGTHELLAYVHDVNVLSDGLVTINKKNILFN
jgi:hypothetical protein